MSAIGGFATTFGAFFEPDGKDVGQPRRRFMGAGNVDAVLFSGVIEVSGIFR